MTEASDDGNYLVRVQAQVMTRDDSSGGWVPLSGGGLANVSVRRRVTSSSGSTNGTSSAGCGGGGTGTVAVITPSSSTPTSNQSTTGGNNNNTSLVTSLTSLGSSSTSPSSVKRNHEYLIYGRRIKDQSVVLSCTIKKDFQYHKVMPTFHHWCTGEKKFGLTFQTAADARAFDKGVRRAMEELLEGLTDATLRTGHPDVGDDGVFMTVNLPAEPPDPRQSTEPPRGIVRVPNYHSQCSDFLDPHKSTSIHYISPCVKVAPTHHHPLESSGDVGTDNYPYVQLTTLNHDYLYPVIDDHKGDRNTTERRNSTGSLKKPDIIVSQPTKNTEKQRNARLRCKYCQDMYLEHSNPRGSCEYAPDTVKKGIAKVSCLLCAQGMLYHCMSDAEGDFTQNPCSCSAEDGCGRRWFGLALLSLIVPCLCLYPPLRAIHWCGMACGICGGRHYPME